MCCLPSQRHQLTLTLPALNSEAVTEPIFWLGLSLLLVAASLTAVLIAAIPALQELARAARSAEKLFDTLRREMPPTLESIRLTGLEISDLTDDLSNGVQNAGSIAKQVNQSLSEAKQQVQGASVNTRGVFMGVKAAWQTWQNPGRRRRARTALRSSSRAAGQYSGQEISSEPSYYSRIDETSSEYHRDFTSIEAEQNSVKDSSDSRLESE